MPKQGGPVSGVMLGLDLGTKFIKVAEVAARGNTLELLSAGIVPSPANLFAGDVISDPELAGATIRALLQQIGVHTNKVVASVRGQTSLVVRIIEVPKMREEEVADAMRWEVERHVPFAATGGVAMDYALLQPMEMVPDDGTAEVLLAVAEESLVKTLVDVIESAGLEPVALDIEPLALGRCFVSKDPDLKEKTIAILQMGARTSELTIISEDNPHLTRNLGIGGDNLTVAISNALGIREEEAEKIKKRHGEILLDKLGTLPSPPTPSREEEEEEAPFFPFTPPSAYELPAEELEEEKAPPPKMEEEPSKIGEVKEEVFNAMLPILGDMVNELRRSFEYMRARIGELQVEKLILTGGGALLPNIDKFFSLELGIPTEIGDPLKGLEINPRLSPLYIKEISPLLSPAIGLALRDFV